MKFFVYFIFYCILVVIQSKSNIRFFVSKTKKYTIFIQFVYIQFSYNNLEGGGSK